MSFSDLGLLPELMRAVADKGYDTPSPIQVQAIPAVLAGRDVLAGAQTGTGKTAGFVLPILQLLAADQANGSLRAPRALVLTPTRELAAQVAQSARDYGKYMQLRTFQVFGGVSINPQISALRSGCDILVATPGRLLDLAQQRAVDLSKVQVLVLDEADRMLDMGFIPDIRRIIKLLPQKRQNLLFSATYSDDIRGLAERLLHNPLSVQVAPRNAPIELVEQRAYRVQKEQKRHLLVHLIQEGQWRRHSGRGNPWQQEPGRPGQGTRHVQARPGHLSGRHRSRCARTRHQGVAASGQLRVAQRAGRLRASHRPHRPRRRQRRGDLIGVVR
jgi:ATP-dependent RNA helicase RhlE